MGVMEVGRGMVGGAGGGGGGGGTRGRRASIVAVNAHKMS